MTFSDKLIALRKKAGWSQEELAERLNVSRQSVSKWESAQSMPDIDKILQLSSLFSVTTDCLLKDTQDDTQPAAAETSSPLPRVTLTQAEDYLTKAQANAPQMALATALCTVSPIPLLALGTVRELGLLGLDDNLAGGLGMIALLVLVAVAVVLFMQCGAAVREYEFLEKEPIETEHGVTALVRERRAAFAPEYDRANRIGAALCILAAVPLFAAVMVGVSFFDVDVHLSAVGAGRLRCVRLCAGGHGAGRHGSAAGGRGLYPRAQGREKAADRADRGLLAGGGCHLPVVHLRPQRQRPAAVQLVHLGHCGRGLRRVCGGGKGVCAEKSVKEAAPDRVMVRGLLYR